MIYILRGPIQRSVYPPPAQTLPRQFIPRPERGRGCTVSQSGALRQYINREFPVTYSLKTGGSSQAIHIGYDLQGEPTFEEESNKLQRLEESHKVCHVGYDLHGEPVDKDSSNDFDIHNEMVLETEDVSGYPA